VCALKSRQNRQEPSIKLHRRTVSGLQGLKEFLDNQVKNMRQASDIACLTLKAGSVSLIVRRGESISEAIFDSVNQSLIDGRVITGTAAS
jgi:hypothetical protein